MCQVLVRENPHKNRQVVKKKSPAFSGYREGRMVYTQKSHNIVTLPFQPRPRKALGILPIDSGGFTSLSLSSAPASLFPIYLQNYYVVLTNTTMSKVVPLPWLFVML